MPSRLDVITSLIGTGETLADVGCDHGIVSYNALKSNSFKKVIISDISSKSLQKAITLLKPFKERVTAYVCDGMVLYEGKPTVAVISGMGGEEISHILNGVSVLPSKLILAPQKNTPKVRETLIEKGYMPIRDFTFLDGKIFYDIIVAEKGKRALNQLEIKYGVENLALKPKDFILKINKEIEFIKNLLNGENLSEQDIQNFNNKLNELKGILE